MWQKIPLTTQILRKSQHVIVHQGKEYSFAMVNWDIRPNMGAIVEFSECQAKAYLNHNAAVANFG